MHKYLAVLLFVALTGCAGKWVKDGVSESQAISDNNNCMNLAQRRVSDSRDIRYGGIPSSSEIMTDPEVFKYCMIRRGYYWQEGRDE